MRALKIFNLILNLIIAPSLLSYFESDFETDFQVSKMLKEDSEPNLMEKEEMHLPNFSYNFKKSEIDSLGAINLIDILDFAPGMSNSMTVMGFYKLSSRGLRGVGRYALIFNGYPLHDHFSERAYWQIPTNLIGSVRVLYGPGESNINSGMLGEVRAEGFEEEGAFLGAEIGAFQTYRFHATYGLRLKSFELDLALMTDLSEGPKLSIIEDKEDRGMLTQADRRFLGGLVNFRIPFGTTGKSFLYLNSFSLGDARGAYMGGFYKIGPGSKLSDIIYGLIGGVRAWPAENLKIIFEIGGGQDFVSGNFKILSDAAEKNQRSEKAYETVNMLSNLKVSALVAEKHLLETQIGVGLKGVLQKNGAAQTQEICKVWKSEQSWLSACSFEFFGDLGYKWAVFDWLTLSLGGGFWLESASNYMPEKNFEPRAALKFEVYKDNFFWLSYRTGHRNPSLEEHASEISLLGPELLKTFEINYESEHQLKPYYFEFQTSLSYSMLRDGILEQDDEKFLNGANYDAVGVDLAAKFHFSTNNTVFFNFGWFRSLWVQEDCASFFEQLPKKCTFITNIPQLSGQVGAKILIEKIGQVSAALKLRSERRNNMRHIMEVRRKFRIPPSFNMDFVFISEAIWDYFTFKFAAYNIFNVLLQDDVRRPDIATGLLPRDPFRAYAGITARF